MTMTMTVVAVLYCDLRRPGEGVWLVQARGAGGGAVRFYTDEQFHPGQDVAVAVATAAAGGATA